MDIIRQLEEEQLRKDELDFNTGDTVRVHYRIKEGTRERIQVLKVLLLKFKELVLDLLLQLEDYLMA